MPVTFIRKSPSEDAILEAAANMEKKIAAAFLKAVEAMKGTIQMNKLTEALAAHDTNGVLSVLALDQGFADALGGKGLAAGVESFRDALQATFAAGAKAAVNQLPSQISADLSFNMMNPEAIQHLASYDFGLIQQISGETKDAIRQILLRAFNEGGSPAQQARQIRDVIGLTANQEKAVANYRSFLENGQLKQTLTRALRDGRFDQSVLNAAAKNKPLAQGKIDQMVDRYQQRYLNYRAETIARTESIRASNKGQQEVWRQAQNQGLIASNQLRVWITSGDDATCEICSSLDGQTAKIGEEFDDGIMEPPDPHPSCRCTVGLDL